MNKSKMNRTKGSFITLFAVVISLVATVMYLIFGITSGTFTGWVFVPLAVAVCVGLVLFFYEGYISDFMPLVIVALLTVALMLLVRDSIGDITEFFSRVGLFGNPANVPMRVAIAVVVLVSIIVAIISSFMERVKK